MDNQHRLTEQDSEAGTATIAFRGSDARRDAELIQNKLQESGLTVAPLSEAGKGEPLLGVAEIIITIVVTAAVKAVITTALNQLEEYLSERAGGPDVNIQVAVKEPATARAKRFPISLGQATKQTVTAFCENIRQAVSKL